MRFWSPADGRNSLSLILGGAAIGAASMLSGCNCCTCAQKPDQRGGGEPIGVAQTTPRPQPMAGGQPVMPLSKAFAQKGDRLTVLATIQYPIQQELTAKVTVTPRGPTESKYDFSNVGKLEYQGATYDAVAGMKIPAKAGMFSFDIVINSNLAADATDVVAYVIDVVLEPGSSEKSQFGLVVDLPAGP